MGDSATIMSYVTILPNCSSEMPEMEYWVPKPATRRTTAPATPNTVMSMRFL